MELWRRQIKCHQVPLKSMELGDVCFGYTRAPWNSMQYSMEVHGNQK